MVVRHHVNKHRRKGYGVNDYMRGRGSKVQGYKSAYAGPLTYGQRERLPDDAFAVILKDGTRKYPIDTENRARAALARVEANGNPHEIRMVRREVKKRYPQIKIKKDPIVLADKRIMDYDEAQAEAANLRAQGYKVRVIPVTPSEAGHFTLRKVFGIRIQKANDSRQQEALGPR